MSFHVNILAETPPCRFFFCRQNVQPVSFHKSEWIPFSCGLPPRPVVFDCANSDDDIHRKINAVERCVFLCVQDSRKQYTHIPLSYNSNNMVS